MYNPLPPNVTIKESSIHGLGLYATEDIRKGVLIGRIHFKSKEPNNDQNINKINAPYNVLRTIQPIREITQMAHSRNVLVHTDAAQSAGKIQSCD